MEMIDVPREVKEGVRTKWIRVLNAATNNKVIDYWQKCSLCDYMNQSDLVCPDKCPLYSDDWCTDNKHTSRLHEKYHKNSREDWIKAIQEFVDMMNKELEEE